MTTEAQATANRSNAQKSTGPRTPEGKAAVAQNAVQHGLLARAAVLHGEDWDEYTRFHEEMRDELYPDGVQEEELAERIVDLSWRLRRARRYQNAVFEALYDQYAAEVAEPAVRADPVPSVPSDPVLGGMLLADFSGERVLERVLLYERRIESSLSRARSDLRSLKKERREGGRVRGSGISNRIPDTRPLISTTSCVATNTPDAQGPFGETKPICGGVSSLRSQVSSQGNRAASSPGLPTSNFPPETAAEPPYETKPVFPPGERREDVGRECPSHEEVESGLHEEPPGGVTTNRQEAEEQTCETKPISTGATRDEVGCRPFLRRHR